MEKAKAKADAQTLPIRPFDHPYFEAAFYRHCSVCHAASSRVVCITCKRPACPVAATIRGQATLPATTCNGCGLTVAATPEEAETQDAAHARDCLVCAADTPLVGCDKCGWLVCAHCAPLAEPAGYHVSRCAAVAANVNTLEDEMKHFIEGGSNEEIARLIHAYETWRIGKTLQLRNDETPQKARAEWDAIRRGGIGRISTARIKTIMSTKVLPGMSSRGASVAELLAVGLLYRDDMSSEAQMQVVLTLYMAQQLMTGIRAICVNLGKAAATSKTPLSEHCYLVMPACRADSYVGMPACGLTPLTLWRRDMESPGANAVYVVTLMDTSADENAYLLNLGNPAMADPEEVASWSPKVRESRQAAWDALDKRVKRKGIASHQILVRLVKAGGSDGRLVVRVVQSHIAAYGLADWFAGRVPDAAACREWLGPLENEAAVVRLGTVLEQLADPNVDDAARSLQYTRLTGVPLPDPLQPMRLVTWRLNMNI